MNFGLVFKAADGTGIVTNNGLTNIPVRRNYITDVTGNLLTKNGKIQVTLDPAFNAEDINTVDDPNSYLDKLSNAIDLRHHTLTLQQGASKEETIDLENGANLSIYDGTIVANNITSDKRAYW